MAKKIKPTDIPNGYIVLGPNGNNLLVDYDDNGKGSSQGTEIRIDGWPKEIVMRGRLLPTLIVLVHSVKGVGSILVKRLQTREVKMDGMVITISKLAKMGKLGAVADSIWKEYMEEKRKDGGNGLDSAKQNRRRNGTASKPVQ